MPTSSNRRVGFDDRRVNPRKIPSDRRGLHAAVWHLFNEDEPVELPALSIGSEES